MAGYGLFQTSTLGMRSQSHAMNTIGINIANYTTGGYKRTDTEFHTLLSNSIDHQSDIGGVSPKDYLRADSQGTITASQRTMDIAIAGSGFFQVTPNLDMSGDIFYTRDGSLDITIAGGTTAVTDDGGNPATADQGYLTDKNGYFVLGWPAETDGTFNTSADPVPLQVDQYAFTSSSQPSTTGNLELNLPSEAAFGDDAILYNVDVVDSNGVRRSVGLNFQPSTTENQWGIVTTGDNLTTSSFGPGTAFSNVTVPATSQLSFSKSGNDQIVFQNAATSQPVAGAFAGLKAGDQITIANSTSNDGTFTISSISSDQSTLTLAGSPLVTAGFDGTDTTGATVSSTQIVSPPMVFSQKGQLTSPQSYTLEAEWDDGATASVAFDVSNMVQFSGGFMEFNYQHNGHASANMTGFSFDSGGNVVGQFSDGDARKVYQLSLASFSNPNGLEAMNGMLFKETSLSGTPNVFSAGATGQATFIPEAHELSNVDLVSEFSKMILVQNAYNSNATAFKTVDEMTTVARDLKA